MRVSKSCPYCARSNVAGCNLNKNIYSEHPCYDFIRKLEMQCSQTEENKMKNPKYFVFNPKKGLPKQPHATLIEAESEAKRIADIETDTEILVVQVVLGITKPSKQFIYRNYKK
jgi:hypothetical protein